MIYFGINLEYIYDVGDKHQTVILHIRVNELSPILCIRTNMCGYDTEHQKPNEEGVVVTARIHVHPSELNVILFSLCVTA